MEERPKTSRGKAHPSPEEFFDYVIPSPERKLSITNNQRDLDNSQKYNARQNVRSAGRTPFRPESVSAEFQLRLNSVPTQNTDKRTRVLGCWLFGSVLRL